MKMCVLALAVAGLCAGAAQQTFTGVIHDNRCIGPNCATRCPVTKGPTYTLQAGADAWVLSDQKTPARYVGKRVVVTGTLGANNRLKIASIAPAR